MNYYLFVQQTRNFMNMSFFSSADYCQGSLSNTSFRPSVVRRRPSSLFVNKSSRSQLLLQFSTNSNQTWHNVRTHKRTKKIGSRILNFCLWVEKSRRLCQFSSIYSNHYSSYVSQPILTKLGTKLEPIGGQKMLGAEFWIFDLGCHFSTNYWNRYSSYSS